LQRHSYRSQNNKFQYHKFNILMQCKWIQKLNIYIILYKTSKYFAIKLATNIFTDTNVNQ